MRTYKRLEMLLLNKGGAVSPTLTCSTEIYVYEVIFEG